MFSSQVAITLLRNCTHVLRAADLKTVKSFNMSIFSVVIEGSILLTIMEVEVKKEERTHDIIKIIHVLIIHPKGYSQ